jgi:ABC-type amino acid transport substrate-binding protein
MQLACIESSDLFSPIATQRHSILGKEASAYGGLIFRLKSNDTIKTISDIKGKRLGVGFALAMGAFALPWQVFALTPLDS